jgi:hypothetical protein
MWRREHANTHLVPRAIEEVSTAANLAGREQLCVPDFPSTTCRQPLDASCGAEQGLKQHAVHWRSAVPDVQLEIARLLNR